VDRPKSGHGRHDSGSITVVDLIRRQQGPVRIPSADEAATVEFVDGLLGRPTDETTDFDEHRSWLARSAKLAGLALGSLALCGSMGAAATLTHHRAHATTTRPAPIVLTGVGALRPDTVAAQLSGRHTTAPGHDTTTGPVATPASARGDAPTVARGRAIGTIVGTTTHTAPPPPSLVGTPLTPIAVVRAFYQLVGTDPGVASELITPALLATDPVGFDQAWSSMSEIQIESIEQTSSDTVQAAIRILEPDGTWLRVVELLHVTQGSTPLINGAELLSAQRG